MAIILEFPGRKKPEQPLTVKLAKRKLADLPSPEDFYPANPGRVPPYIQQIWALAVGYIHYVVWNYFNAVDTSDYPGLLVSITIFTLAVVIGAYMALGGQRYWTAINAINKLTESVETAATWIGNLEDAAAREECHVLLIYLLRVMYKDLKGISAKLENVKGKEIGRGHGLVLRVFSLALKKNKLDNVLAGGNGAVRHLLQARAQSKSVWALRFSVSLKWACRVFLVLLIVSLSLYLHGQNLSPEFQSCIVGTIAYGAWLLIVVAGDLGDPYGQGKSKLALRKRWQRYEELLQELCMGEKEVESLVYCKPLAGAA